MKLFLNKENKEKKEMEINAGESHVEESKNESRLVKNDGTILMLDPKAVMIIAKQGKEEKDKAEVSR